MATKSSTSYDGVPSGRRAWMWMCTPPSSTIRRASAAYSSGVYGIAGHWSRLAIAPEIAHVMTTGSSSIGSDRDHAVAFPGTLDPLARGHLERAADRRPRLARVDHVVDHVVARGHVHVDDLPEALDQLLALGRRVLGLLDLLTEDDLNRSLCSHHADLSRGPGDDQVGLIGPAAHHVVAGAVRLAQHHGDLGNRRVGRGIEHLGAVADDPGLLDLGPHHEPRHVHQEHQRDPV